MADEIEEIEKNLGTVNCGDEIWRHVEIVNESEITQVYTIQSEEGTSENENIYLDPVQSEVRPLRKLKLNVRYRSFLPNVRTCTNFLISASGQPAYRLKIRAKNLGTNVKTSCSKLKFLCCGQQCQVTKPVELINSSRAAAKFQFDLEPSSVFQVSNNRGVVPGEGRLVLKMTFTPCKHGAYYKEIFCLFQFQQPITFEAIGIWQADTTPDPTRLRFNYPPAVNPSNGFDSYMQMLTRPQLPEEEIPCPEKQKLKRLISKYKVASKGNKDKKDEEDWPEDVPEEKTERQREQVLFLTKYFITCNAEFPVQDTTTLINLNETTRYYFEWSSDCTGHFRMEPRCGVIEAGQKLLMTPIFAPDVPNNLFHAELDLRLIPYLSSWTDMFPIIIDLPTTLSLRLLGSSFSQKAPGWMAQCSITPSTLTLPSCTPHEIVYAAFIIERRAHLPLTFRLIPSQNSKFTARPPQGYLSEKYQLVLVQFDARSQEPGRYSEEWTVRFNETEANDEGLRLSAEVENPRIEVGDDDSHELQVTFPGAVNIEGVPVMNPTSLSLWYRFTVPEEVKWLEIPQPEGKVEPHSSVCLEVMFKPNQAGEYVDDVICALRSTSLPDRVTHTSITFIGSSEHTFLVATPNQHDFGKCQVGVERTVKFHLFNFSPVLLNFELRPAYLDFPLGNPGADVIINPRTGEISGKGQIEAEVTVKPHDTGIVEYSIECFVLKSSSAEILKSEAARKVLNLKIEGIVSAFQVIDLDVVGAGPLFSPSWLWKMMEIDRLNELMKNLMPGKAESVDMRLPEAMVESRPITIRLLLQSKRDGAIQWQIKRNALCGCPPKKEQQTMSTSRLLYDCPHRRTMNIKPLNGELDIGSSQAVLEMTLNYEILGPCCQQWVIYLTEKRQVTIRTNIIGLSIDEPSPLSMYLNPIFKLKATFIGDMEPPTQLFWMYNNTAHPAAFVAEEIDVQNKTEFGQSVFSCSNPCETIPPFSCLPVAIIFRPNELKEYTANMPLRLHNQVINLVLHGRGVLTNEPCKQITRAKTIPEVSLLDTSVIPLVPSTRVRNLKTFVTHSRKQSVFLVLNKSLNSVWTFEWHRFQIQNIIHAHIVPPNGQISPGESVMFKLVIESSDFPTEISFSIPCDVIDCTQLQHHQEVLALQGKLTEKMQNHFTITERGISYEAMDVTIPKRPELHHFFITVNTTVVSSRNMELKLSLKQQTILEADPDMLAPSQHMTPDLGIADASTAILVLEKILWTALNETSFKKRLLNFERLGNPVYPQKSTCTLKEMEQMQARTSVAPSKNFTQTIIGNVLFEVLHDLLSKKQKQVQKKTKYRNE